ncbi:hypothetical protein H0H81_002127 [Sphagnurus paluster]|uniref:Uncharacterized protein n=1 Tax=Sphagnurus paluster TaxID=117069 RepID=A0A9P7GPM6_9AGAR|nr:hypothetical protein H0H81_002127 [Sphagnurus paluster]
MSHNPQEMPARKRRRVMEIPDGFEKPKSAIAPKVNVQVPRFASAFEGATPATQQKPPPKSKMDARPTFTSKPLSKSHNKPTSKSNLKHLSAPSFPLPPNEEKTSAPAYRVLPPPDPRFATMDEPSTSTIPVLQLRPPPPLPPPLPIAPSKPAFPLNDLVAPTLLAPAETPLEKSMRTISTTEIALATDLFTDNGAAELAHIFLQDQHPEMTVSNKEEYQEWNIGMSPQKGAKFVKGKGKEAKFVKSGLAARASELASRSHTSLALWHKETELQLASSSSSHLKPDLRLIIVKIIDCPTGAKSNSPRKQSFSTAIAVSPGVALCRIVSGPPAEQLILGSRKETQHRLVVLSFPISAPPRLRGKKAAYVRNPEDFLIGREVYVWKPWLEVSLISHPVYRADFCSTVDPEVAELAAAPFPSLPSTFPYPLPSPQPPSQDGHSGTTDRALLCSRFVIIPIP